MTTTRLTSYTALARRSALVLALALAGVMTLFMFEAAPFRMTTNSAEAWQCKSMTASPATIVRGESTTLTWSFGAPETGVYVTLDPGGKRFEGTQGSTTVSPTETTTFTATARKPNTHQIFTCSVKVTVTAPAPVCEMSAAPATIDAGKTAVLSFKGTNVSAVSIDQGVGSVPVVGTKEVSPATTTTYTGTFTGENGTEIICHATVKVTVPPKPAPVCEMSASPATIERGASATLSWNSSNVSSVTIDQGLGSVAASGTRSTGALATTTTYTGTFTGTDGSTIQCSAKVTVTEPTPTPGPVCTLLATPTSVRAGETTTLTWTSERAVSATIDQGVGVVATTGTTSVAVPSRTTYTGTFTADDGRTVQCTAEVAVEVISSGSSSGGGGGRCLNCGGSRSRPPERKPPVTDDPTPSPKVVLSKVVTNAGGFITLDQVPYTGFTAGPVMTTLFWVCILALSAVIAYVLTAVRPLDRMRTALYGSRLAARGNAGVTHTSQYVSTPVNGGVLAPHTYMESPASPGTSIDSLIEEYAHREYILLSPEALRAVRTEIERVNGDAQGTLQTMFERAKSLFAREDGWILLSKERAGTILSAPVAETPTAVVERAGPIAGPLHDVDVRNTRPSISLASVPDVRTTHAPAPAEATTRTRETVSTPAEMGEATFLGHLVRSEEQQAYAQLRSAMQSGAGERLIGSLVRKLDEVYKHRLEGNHVPDAELAKLTSSWSNNDFEVVLGMLVECIDYSYANNRIGTKVALAKIFEHFKRA